MINSIFIFTCMFLCMFDLNFRNPLTDLHPILIQELGRTTGYIYPKLTFISKVQFSGKAGFPSYSSYIIHVERLSIVQSRDGQFFSYFEKHFVSLTMKKEPLQSDHLIFEINRKTIVFSPSPLNPMPIRTEKTDSMPRLVNYRLNKEEFCFA